jgi:hypothetical protein
MRQGPHWVREEEMDQASIAPFVDKSKVEPALIGPVLIGPVFIRPALDWRKL